MNDLRVVVGSLSSCSRLRLSHRIFYNTTNTWTRNLHYRFRGTRTTTTTPISLGVRYLSRTRSKMSGEQTKWTAPVVRKTFLDFFEGKGHTVGKWRGNFFCLEQNTAFRTHYPARKLGNSFNGLAAFHYACFIWQRTDLRSIQFLHPLWYPTMTRPSSSQTLV
jgi:hypothetical protein